jgi:transcriptional regulator CtsR
MPAGRPTIELDWEEFDKLCEIQCTLKEIASWFECSPDTIERRVKEKFGINFADYYEQKRGKGFISLRRLQFQAACSGSIPMLIWLGKQWLGQKDKQEIDHTTEDGKGLKITLNYARKGKE